MSPTAKKRVAGRAAAEIAALKAGLVALRKQHASLRKEHFEMLGERVKDMKRLRWLEDNAEREIRITNRNGIYSVDRWHQRYVSYHSFSGTLLYVAIDRAIEATTPPPAPTNQRGSNKDQKPSRSSSQKKRAAR